MCEKKNFQKFFFLQMRCTEEACSSFKYFVVHNKNGVLITFFFFLSFPSRGFDVGVQKKKPKKNGVGFFLESRLFSFHIFLQQFFLF